MTDEEFESQDFSELYPNLPETEIRVEEQDLRLVKHVLSNRINALEFTSTYNENLFIGDIKPLMREVIWYVKNYREVPTTRILLDKVQDNPELQNNFRDVLEMVERTEIDPVEFCYDLDKIKNKHVKGEMHQLRNILEEDKDLKYQLREAERILGRVKEVSSGKKQNYVQKTLKEFCPEFLTKYEMKQKDPEFDRGILTGYSFFDHVTNGCRNAEMGIIVAESGVGKSLMLNNMGIQMWHQKNNIFQLDSFQKGYDVIYFSAEMPYEACFRRTLARLADVPLYGIRDAKLDHDEFRRLQQALKFIENFPSEFQIVDIPRGLTVEQIELRFGEACLKFRPKIVIVDYLSLLEDDSVGGEDDWLKLGRIAGKLHEFARVYDIVLLTAAQLNRPPQTKNKEGSDLIGLHRIGRSALIAHHANYVIQIENRKDEKSFADLIYHIIKNRDGEGGKHALRKKFSHSSIHDSDPPYQPKIVEGECAGPNEEEDLTEQLKQLFTAV